MWANAQRDDCPAEYRWRPVLNAAKVWLMPTARLPCSNAAMRRVKDLRGRKVNFAHGKIPLHSTAAENVYIVYQPR